MTVAGRLEVGPEPRGVVLSADGKTAYVAVGVANEVVQVDLEHAAGRPPAWPWAASRGASPSRRTARSCSSATPDRRTSRSISTAIAGRLPDDPDRGRQPAAGGDQRRRQARLRRQHEEPRVRDHRQQHRPGLGARPAADPRRPRRLRALVRHPLARPAGQGRGRRPRRGRQQRRQVPRRQPGRNS